MVQAIHMIPVAKVALAFTPVLIVIGILYRWSLTYRQTSYAAARMLAQLLLVGYFLTHLFAAKSFWVPMLILLAMLLVSSWTAIHAMEKPSRKYYRSAALGIAFGAGSVLMFIMLGIFDLQPWYQLQYLFPLAGMTFATSMNAVSLAAERIEAETGRGVSYHAARNLALKTALIPHINSMLAAGIVSLPGTMTGQILSGVDPLIAVRYQIIVMCMMFGAAGLSTALFLKFLQRYITARGTAYAR